MSKETKIKLLIIMILVIILAILMYFTVIEINYNADSIGQKRIENSGQMSDNSSSQTIETRGAVEITNIQTSNSTSYSSSTSDESAVLVTEGGNLTIDNGSITKTGDTTNTENSEFYGVNAGILAKTDGIITINNSKITTNAKGANAVFATGENTKIYISDTEIETNSDSSRGLDSTYGGYIEADNVTISTKGGSCATLATDRGEGTVIAKNSTLSTAGSGSPIIYSTGSISLEDSEGEATGAQMVVVEGKNTATVKNSTLVCSGKGNRGDVDNCGIMIYQSMSGDAGEGTGTFGATNSSLSISSSSSYYTIAPFFFITNTEAVINLENNQLQYGSNILLKVEGTSEWGNSGNNGGDVTLNATNQELVGDIKADNISTVQINLKDNSTLNGTINGENTAKNISIILDKSSTWTLTGDTYITSLTDEDTTYSNINFNGYTLYVNGNAIN